MSTPVTALAASDMRIVRVIEAFEAVVANVAGTTWLSTIAPCPVEAPREREITLARPESLAVASIA